MADVFTVYDPTEFPVVFSFKKRAFRPYAPSTVDATFSVEPLPVSAEIAAAVYRYDSKYGLDIDPFGNEVSSIPSGKKILFEATANSSTLSVQSLIVKTWWSSSAFFISSSGAVGNIRQGSSLSALVSSFYAGSSLSDFDPVRHNSVDYYPSVVPHIVVKTFYDVDEGLQSFSVNPGSSVDKTMAAADNAGVAWAWFAMTPEWYLNEARTVPAATIPSVIAMDPVDIVVRLVVTKASRFSQTGQLLNGGSAFFTGIISDADADGQADMSYVAFDAGYDVFISTQENVRIDGNGLPIQVGNNSGVYLLDNKFPDPNSSSSMSNSSSSYSSSFSLSSSSSSSFSMSSSSSGSTNAALASFEITTTATPEDFKVQIDGAVNLVVNWGDGNEETFNGSALRTHSYATADTYTMWVVSGTATRIAFGSAGTTPTLLTAVASIISDTIGLTSTIDMFQLCTNLSSFAANWFDAASAAIIRMDYMFDGAVLANPSVALWDVSSVTRMDYLFQNASSFNSPCGDWDTSSVINMTAVFAGATIFDQDIGLWETGNVGTFLSMFSGATAFNQDISGWDVTGASTLQLMFNSATAFDQDISTWDVSGVSNFSFMFRSGNFNQDLSSWVMTSATTLSQMFRSSLAFDQDISGWDVSGVTDMSNMFLTAVAWSQTNYDKLLSLATGWPSQVLKDNVPFHAGTAKYDDESVDIANGRAHLVAATPTGHGWTITDGGAD